MIIDIEELKGSLRHGESSKLELVHHFEPQGRAVYEVAVFRHEQENASNYDLIIDGIYTFSDGYFGETKCELMDLIEQFEITPIEWSSMEACTHTLGVINPFIHSLSVPIVGLSLLNLWNKKIFLISANQSQYLICGMIAE